MGTSDEVPETDREWTDNGPSSARLGLHEKFGVGEVVQEDILLGVKAS